MVGNYNFFYAGYLTTNKAVKLLDFQPLHFLNRLVMVPNSHCIFEIL